MFRRRRDTEPIETSAVPGCFQTGAVATYQSQASTATHGDGGFITISFSGFPYYLIGVNGLMSLHNRQKNENHDFAKVKCNDLVQHHLCWEFFQVFKDRAIFFLLFSKCIEITVSQFSDIFKQPLK